ncbi:MAG: heavy metal translocating P-type ATPase, partial [Actinomycetes bacterium]
IEAAGYGATLPSVVEPESAQAERPEDAPELVALRRRVAICAALSVPVVLMAMFPPLQFRNWQWLALTLASPVAVWGAWPFHLAAWRNARHRTTTMDTLVSVGVIAAYAWSVVALFFGDAGRVVDAMHGAPMADMTNSLFSTSVGGLDHTYLEVAAAVPTVILLGRYFELRTRRRTGAAVTALLSLGAKEVSILAGDGSERRVPVEELSVDDRFVVRPGERIATDGVVEEGASAVDTSLLTGESVPVDVAAGDAVTGATICVSGRLVVRATRVGADTQLARIARLVEDAQTGKAEVQRLADRVAGVFVPIVIAIALGTLAVWAALGDPVRGFGAAVAVLVIACPCALGLATPMALMMGTGRGAQLGILIRGPEVLESTRRVDTVVLDKTGTVTTGRMELVSVVPADGESPDSLLRVVGAIESASEHPTARAIAAAAADAGEVPEVADFHNHAGRGVTGTVDGQVVAAGRPAFVAEQVGASSDPMLTTVDDLTANGSSVVAVGWSGQLRGLLAVADTPRPTSAAA